MYNLVENGADDSGLDDVYSRIGISLIDQERKRSIKISPIAGRAPVCGTGHHGHCYKSFKNVAFGEEGGLKKLIIQK